MKSEPIVGIFARAGGAAERFVRRYMPDPFVLVLLLTLVALGLGLLTMKGDAGYGAKSSELIKAWTDGFGNAEILKFGLQISSFTSKAKSLTWGDFVFTQNQPIYCRSLFPCQDTPSSKSTFDIDIHLEEDDNKLSVYATGLRQGTSNKFIMDIPIPTYLFAFLIGNFEHRKVNHRIGIVA